MGRRTLTRLAPIITAALTLALAGCGDDGDDTTTVVTTAPTTETTTASNAEVTLNAVDGSPATGTASVLPDGRPVVSIEATDLAPTGPRENYIIWLYENDDRAFPVGRQTVGDDGTLEGEVPIPRGLLAYVSRFDKVRIGRATNTETQAALRGAVGAGSLPPFVGVTVLEGDNPRG